MSSFTNAICISPVRRLRRGVAALLPPGFFRGEWIVYRSFTYAVGDLQAPLDLITVSEGFRFDGASVPYFLQPFFPSVHPDYLQAAALHDRLLCNPRYSRLRADRVFVEALGVLGMPRHWRTCFFAAVRIGAGIAWLRRIVKLQS